MELPVAHPQRGTTRMHRKALIAGVTGIVGNNLAQHLVQHGWQVTGLARRPSPIEGVETAAADLLDPASLAGALEGIQPTAVFFSTWLRQPTEAENIRVNSAMVRNLLDALRPQASVQHVGLVTGLKHYLGPFEHYGKGVLPATPFREEQPRLPIENFYYAQEDEVFAAAARDGFTWSVHRPHTIVGFALGNAMNMGVTLAVYATLCRETGMPFRFPGSPAQWNSLTDMTDARLLASHLRWAAETAQARNEAFNVVNGDVFRWNWMWTRLAAWFGLEAAPFTGEVVPLEQQLRGYEDTWRAVAEKHNLIQPDLHRLSSAWHTDADLGRPVEVLTDMSKSRRLGFLEYQPTDDSFFDLFGQLVQARVIPAP
jgi:nucleoside-diphosphate-sugar epimerase